MTTFLPHYPLPKNLRETNYLLYEQCKKIDASCAKKMIESKNKATYSTKFYWHYPSNFLFVKYQAKEKKSVCLLSSMQDSTDVDTSNKKKKPELILFYNANKVGVDCFDQMACLCTTRSASRRWPVAV